MSIDSSQLKFCLVPHKQRLASLIGFVRSHIHDRVVVVCCSTGVTEYLGLLFNLLEIRATFIHGKQDSSHRTKSLKRFNDGEISLLFSTARLCQSEKILAPNFLVHFDIPKEAKDEVSIIRNVAPSNFILFLDEQHSEYLKILQKEKLDITQMNFDVKKVPPVLDQVNKLLKKNHRLYQCSMDGYRELIQTYVNHGNADVFNAQKLNLLDVAINFGITAPPKLPLSK